jgi:2-succinyl-5-enolpyruvyl-6-hydroxy-3-cyclohexene-1-carboxylate synthase
VRRDVNPSTAFGRVLADELVRCGLREAVLAPGSRSTPLALALFDAAQAGRLRLHVRVDERSAAFLALGLAKASRRPAAVLCTSGTAAGHFHAAVIEADEACVPLIVLTADRPPELRGTGANQTIDQLKLYGSAVRWFCEVGVPEARPGMVGYWRSLACRAWGLASGAAGAAPGPVHLNAPLREPLVPDEPPRDGVHEGLGAAEAGPGSADAGPGSADTGPGSAEAGPGSAEAGLGVAEAGRPVGGPGVAGAAGGDWPEPLTGRPGGAPWTAFATRWVSHRAGYNHMDDPPMGLPGGWPGGGAGEQRASVGGGAPVWSGGGVLRLEWRERGALVCGDGDYDPAPLLELAEAAGWPVLAEPSSGARQGQNALSGYGYLLGSRSFAAAHAPDVIVTAGRPGLSRPQLAFLAGAAGAPPARHVAVAQAPGRWADPARTVTDVAGAVELEGSPPPGAATSPGSDCSWLASWQRADAAALAAVDAILDSAKEPNEPRLARDLAAAMPDGGLLWAASSMPIRDLDQHMRPRAGLRVLANRGASGIDGLVSAAIGAALAHQAAGGGAAVALLGDLAFVHDAAGLMIGPDEPRPDLCLLVVNNDGGGIFSQLEQASLAGAFERIFGTPHGARVPEIARAAGLPYQLLRSAADLPGALRGTGLRVVEVRTQRAAQAALRSRLQDAAARVLT